MMTSVEPASTPQPLVLLAAGRSLRMGRPKPLLRWRGSTLLEHACAAARGGGAKPFSQKGTGRARQGSSRSPSM